MQERLTMIKMVEIIVILKEINARITFKTTMWSQKRSYSRDRSQCTPALIKVGTARPL